MFPDTRDLSEALAEGRAASLALSVDRCRITKPILGNAKGALNEENGQYDAAPPGATVYEGPCKFQIRSDINSNVVEVTAGEKEWAYLTSRCDIPIYPVAPADDPNGIGSTGDPADVRIDMTVECLSCPEDPSMVGRKWQIRADHHKTRATARRLRVTEGV